MRYGYIKVLTQHCVRSNPKNDYIYIYRFEFLSILEFCKNSSFLYKCQSGQNTFQIFHMLLAIMLLCTIPNEVGDVDNYSIFTTFNVYIFGPTMFL